jgi:hypothetical protein
MLRVTDAEKGLREIGGHVLRVAAADGEPGTLLAVDTLARTAEVLGMRVRTVGVKGVAELNVRPANASGTVDVVVHRPGGVPGPPYGLAHRLAWLAGTSLEQATAELAGWRGLVAGWAEAPSRPMCAQVQEDLLAALADDLDTRTAVDALRGSLALDLPAGCLFETWAWADRLLALDLAADVGR